MTLEEQLREAVAKGITHLTLYPTPSADGKKTYWRATATPSTGHKYISVTAADPIEALNEVLKALPKAPKRPPPVGGKVTAAVIVGDHDPEPVGGGLMQEMMRP